MVKIFCSSEVNLDPVDTANGKLEDIKIEVAFSRVPNKMDITAVE